MILSHVFATLLYLVVAGFLVAGANGYLFNRHTLQFEQTGIINLTVEQEPVTVTYNDKSKVYKKSPISLSYLLPGTYYVEVTKPGFIPWTKSIHVNEGEVVINPAIVLFKEGVASQPANEAQLRLLEESITKKEIDTDMDIRSREIWATQWERTYPFAVASKNYRLIGRFMHPIAYATWMPGKNHIIFQIGNEIRVMDRDGANDHVLVRLQSAEPTVFLVTSDGKTLVYREGEQVFQRELL